MASTDAEQSSLPAEREQGPDVRAEWTGGHARPESAAPDHAGPDPAHPDGDSAPGAPVGERSTAWGDGLIARRAPAPVARLVAPASEPTGSEGNRAPSGPRRAPSAPHTEQPAHVSTTEAAYGDVVARQRQTEPEGQGATHVREWTDGRGERAEGTERTGGAVEEREAAEDVLRQRLGALRELVGLSRTRLDSQVLAEAGRVLDAAAARRGLPRAYTTVAFAGATGSGKSSLFNALTGADISEVGLRRPTTAAAVSCTWEVEGADGADGLLDRLGIPSPARHRTRDSALAGLVLIDLPDHDSRATEHREQVDRMLELVDAVVWVVDPEKYADAVLHERYLRQLAGHAEVTFIVLNQTDRLTCDAVDAVLDDLRRLLDEDGMALGEHGEPGAAVLGASALTGDGVAVLREELGDFVAARRAAVLRLNADLDGAMERLRAVYADPCDGATPGLAEYAREDFEDRLAIAVGAAAAGQAAERAWLRQAELASGTPWVRLLRHYGAHAAVARGKAAERVAQGRAAQTSEGPGRSRRVQADVRRGGARLVKPGESLQHARAARPVVAQAVRELADAAAYGLPDAWARTVRESARRGAAGLPEALDEVMEAGASVREGARSTANKRSGVRSRAGSELGSGPGQVVRDVRKAAAEEAAARGAEAGVAGGRPTEPASAAPGSPASRGVRAAQRVGDRLGVSGSRSPSPAWRTAARVGQGLLLVAQVVSVVWAGVMVFVAGGLGAALLPCALCAAATAGGPLLEWLCRAVARGPARAYGLEEERGLRRRAAGCGRTRVLDPVAAELMRYREVREQYAIAAGVVDGAGSSSAHLG